MYCVGINDSYTMSVPLQILRPLAADFDGDVLNIWLIINRPFFEACNAIFNPRNNMYISHNNGLSNPDVCVQKDTVINANTLLWLGRNAKRKGEKERIAKLKAIVAQHAI